MKGVKRSQAGFSILEIILVFVVAAAIIFVGSLALVAKSTKSNCGTNSQAYKDEQAKVKVFDPVVIVPGLPNVNASVSDTSSGTCNLDVAQSYSATKKFSVNMSAADAVASVSQSLKNQGFVAGKENFNKDACSKVSEFIDYSGKGIVIEVGFFETAPGQCDAGGSQEVIQKSDFTPKSVTAIQATISSP
jgi:hypothetical protein